MASAQFFKRLAPFLAATISLIAATDALALTPCANLVATRAGSQDNVRVPANAINCRTAGRISAPSGRVYNCRGGDDANGDTLPNRILLQPNGAPIRLLAKHDYSPSLTAMTLYDVNLGEGAEAEHVLALWQAQQNGFGTNFWTLVVFDAAWRQVDVIDDLEDFGRNHFVQNGSTCALAITKFNRPVIAGPLFYEARFVGLVGNKLTPVSELGTLQRRYTNAFERQRLATFDRQRDVAKQGDLVAWMRGVTP